MSMEYGMIHCYSIKQNLNKKSTTESEFVDTNEYVPLIIWMVMFYEAQGYDITKTFQFKDNESAIKMENIG